MTFKEIFMGEQRKFRPDDSIFKLVKDGWIGLILAVLIGWLAIYLNGVIVIGGEKYFDALVLAVVLGILIRFMFSKFMKQNIFIYKVVPGLIVAQLVLIPIGVILYGAKNFNIKNVSLMINYSPFVLLKIILIVALTFITMFYIGRLFKFNDRFSCLLGFGSAVCGASAIAITQPICKTDYEETSIALVTNTLAVIIAFTLVTTFIVPAIDNVTHANLAGSLYHQTSFVKMALSDMKNTAIHGFDSVYDFGMTIKSIRVALLLFTIPIISYLLNKKLFIPWYMVLFFIAGLFSTYFLSSAQMANVKVVYNYVFTSALAAVGLNADIESVVKRLGIPVIAVSLVFFIGLGFFFLTNIFI